MAYLDEWNSSFGGQEVKRCAGRGLPESLSVFLRFFFLLMFKLSSFSPWSMRSFQYEHKEDGKNIHKA